MASQKVTPSVLHNCLGTLASRNSDHKGYLLWGFVIKRLKEVRIDLLGSGRARGRTPLRRLVAEFVRARFREQLSKAGLKVTTLCEARLTLRKMPPKAADQVKTFRSGYPLQLIASAVTRAGREYRRQVEAFVAPHNPHFESRSGRVSRPARRSR